MAPDRPEWHGPFRPVVRSQHGPSPDLAFRKGGSAETSGSDTVLLGANPVGASGA
jgi:hypothetical protein